MRTLICVLRMRQEKSQQQRHKSIVSEVNNEHYFFSVLSTKRGYKFATFETKEERKVIEGFDRIPYTPETLLEDILSGFPAFPDYRKTNKINNEFENSIHWLLTANNCWFDNIQLDIYPFCEPVFIKTFENGIH